MCGGMTGIIYGYRYNTRVCEEFVDRTYTSSGVEETSCVLDKLDLYLMLL